MDKNPPSPHNSSRIINEGANMSTSGPDAKQIAAFFAAVEAGDLAGVKALLAAGVGPDVRNQCGDTYDLGNEVGRKNDGAWQMSGEINLKAAMTSPESQLEDELIKTRCDLKYEYRADIRDRDALEKISAGNSRRSITSDSPTANSSGFSTKSSPPTFSPPPKRFAAATASRGTMARRQTGEEFNRFQEGAVQKTTSTETLVRRLTSDDAADKVIVATIQKLGPVLRKQCVEIGP
jgi:hypothetical protein